MDDAAAQTLLRFLESSSDAPEVLWQAGLAMIEKAVGEGREARWARFQHYPQGQLRRLRRDVAEGLKLARLAVALQEAGREQHRELNEELHAAAAEAGKRRRRAQTLPAERARLAKLAARRVAG